MMALTYKPEPYQTYCKDFIISHPEAGLFLDMGMGKTAITLSAVEELMFDYFCVKRVLVVAPLQPARDTWPQEVAKWDFSSHMTTSLVIGSREQRIAALNREADIYIVNRENIPWLVDYYKTRWPFDMLVIDELSSFKSSKAARFRALRKVRKYIKRVVGLTGTPASNGLLDLWPELFILDGGKALGRTVTGYREQYFVPDKRNAQVIFSWRLKDGAEAQIYDRIKDTCISMQTADYLQLPERREVRHSIKLSAPQLEQYQQLERDTLLEFKDGGIDAPTAATLINKLLQASGGACYDENGKVKELGTDKLNALDGLVEAANGQPVLVFYAFRHERDRIKAKYPCAVDVKTEGAVEAWNKGEIQMLLAHPASAGHGLNLQYGGHIIIWYGLPLSLELFQQANKRLHRRGQNDTVLIHYLLAEDTRDSWVLDEILALKEERQDRLIDAVKALIEEAKA